MPDVPKAARERVGSSARLEGRRGRPFENGNRYAWKKGQSGNPAGTPKDRASAAAHIEQRLREEFLEEAVDTLIKRAKQDASATALIEALNRMAGKIPDRAELTGGDGNDIQVRVAARKELVAKLERLVLRDPESK